MSQHCQWLCCSPRRPAGECPAGFGDGSSWRISCNQEYSGVAFFNLTVGSNRSKGVRSASGRNVSWVAWTGRDASPAARLGPGWHARHTACAPNLPPG